jgi:hypothetical protein
MSFKRIPSAYILLFILSAFAGIQTAHAEYDVEKLTAHLKEKTDNIQAEYEKLRNGKPLQYLWNTYTHRPHNLYLGFFAETVTSIKDVKCRTEAFFSFTEPNLKKRLSEFVSVFTSENFLRMLFGNVVVNELVRFRLSLGSRSEKCAFVWWDKEPSENPSEFLTFSLRVKHVLYEDMGCEYFGCERMSTLLYLSLMFAYDIRNDTIRFIGLGNKPVVNVKYAEDNMNLPIYARANAETSVQQNDLMCVED